MHLDRSSAVSPASREEISELVDTAAEAYAEAKAMQGRGLRHRITSPASTLSSSARSSCSKFTARGLGSFIIGNGLAVRGRSAHTGSGLRTRALWWFTVLAETAIFVQAGLGVALGERREDRPAAVPSLLRVRGPSSPVGILYSYKTTSTWVRERLYLVYGGGSCS